jgi:N-acetylmuramoyl-L-alanine amidase
MHMRDYPSPNYDERHNILDMLILHYTDMLSGQESLDRMCDPEAKVSAHYMIDEDGTVYTLVPEDKRAWHAGLSHWKGRTNVNAHSIGIELQNPGHGHGYRPFPKAQMEALIQLIEEIRTRWTIPDHFVLGHSDVAPDRKIDPGHLFDWALLASHKIGIWPTKAGINVYTPFINVAQAQQCLETIGYRCPVTGHTDAYTVQVIEAFQRHFCPEELEKGLTPYTTQAMQAVAALVPA